MSFFFTDGGTHTNDGETMTGCSAIARSRLGACEIMFGPVFTAEALCLCWSKPAHQQHSRTFGVIEPLRVLSSIRLFHLDRKLVLFYRFKTRCWRLPWDCAITDECPLWDDKPAVAFAGSATHPYYTASHLLSWRERRSWLHQMANCSWHHHAFKPLPRLGLRLLIR